MRRPVVTIVAAVADNGMIGRGEGLPWHLPADLAFFKKTTSGGTVVMGRKTYETLSGSLPNRRNIVVTRNAGWSVPDAERAGSLDDAIGRCEADECFILGGATVYEQALPIADRMVITHVHAEPEGDTRFPEWERSDWRVVSEERREADERNAHAMTFTVYERA